MSLADAPFSAYAYTYESRDGQAESIEYGATHRTVIAAQFMAAMIGASGNVLRIYEQDRRKEMMTEAIDLAEEFIAVLEARKEI